MASGMGTLVKDCVDEVYVRDEVYFKRAVSGKFKSNGEPIMNHFKARLRRGTQKSFVTQITKAEYNKKTIR